MRADVVDEQWQAVLSLLPDDLEKTAREKGAIVRKRAVKGASDLLRLLMKYAVCDTPSRGTCAWAHQTELADISHVGLLKRLKKCGDWLQCIISKKLSERAAFPRLSAGGLRLRITDATCANRPGSKGTDWRVHLGFDLALMQIDSIELTDHKGGETLCRLVIQPGDVVLSDRGYAHRKGINSVVSASGYVITRINWQNLPLTDLDEVPFDILAHLRTLDEKNVVEWDVMTQPSKKDKIGPIRGRLVALRKDQETAQRDRQNILKQYKKKGKKPDERTLEAAGYIFVFTTLPASILPAKDILELFRFRWQVELAFKRLKEILHLDEMPQGKDELCRVFLLTKLLAALLIEDLADCVGAFSPSGSGPVSSSVGDKNTKCHIEGTTKSNRGWFEHPGLDEKGPVGSGCLPGYTASTLKPACVGTALCFQHQGSLS